MNYIYDYEIDNYIKKAAINRLHAYITTNIKKNLYIKEKKIDNEINNYIKKIGINRIKAHIKRFFLHNNIFM
jgi:ribosomal protein L31E